MGGLYNFGDVCQQQWISSHIIGHEEAAAASTHAEATNLILRPFLSINVYLYVNTFAKTRKYPQDPYIWGCKST